VDGGVIPGALAGPRVSTQPIWVFVPLPQTKKFAKTKYDTSIEMTHAKELEIEATF
jgi:hypothetical protein